MADKGPKIDLICNVVIRRKDGKVLLVPNEGDDRWWIPSACLVPYEHPDEVAPRVVKESGLGKPRVVFSEVESFRGRSGWHVMFNYRADVAGGKGEWFDPKALPQMVHGNWEKQVIAKALRKK